MDTGPWTATINPGDTQIESQTPDVQTLDSQEVLSLLLGVRVYVCVWWYLAVKQWRWRWQ